VGLGKLVINHKVLKAAEGTYYTVPFVVPDGVIQISVSYSYNKLVSKDEKRSCKNNVVDLGIIDGNGRFIGWSGSAKNSVFIGAYSSTSGYLITDISPGEWQIIVGAYKIPKDGLDVTYEITFTSSKPQWLVGDTHIHSDASDGQYDIATLAKMAKKAGLDFIAISNHNNYTDNLSIPTIADMTFLPAVEWTHYKGHFNLFGVKMPFTNSFIANNEEEMLSLISDAKKKGALVSVNHPKCRICPYLWKDEKCFDMVEVWNGPMRGANMDAITWWHEMLMQGRNIPIISGSDYHKFFFFFRIAHPVVYVYAASPSADDIIKAMANGHSYISARVNGITLDLRYENAIMGDEITRRDGIELSISAKGLRPGVRIKLITSEGSAIKWKKFTGGELNINVPVNKNWKFAYLVAYRKFFGKEYVRAITNPIYFL
jgi:hypothetical protein